MEESLTKKILKGLLITGTIAVASSSPYFALGLSRSFSKALRRKKYLKGKREQFNNAFYYLKRKGYIKIEKRRKQIYISLTEQGRKRAGKYQIDELKIERPKSWDGKWRIVVFDVPDLTRLKREALRGKLKQLGFYKFQRSVWLCPYKCQKEINLLREFLGLKTNQLTVIEGRIEEDMPLRKVLGLR